MSPVQDQFGNFIPGAEIYVCQPGTTEVPCLTHQVTVYQDFNLGPPITQPVISDGSGNYTFGCAAPANLQIQVFAKLTQYIYKASCPSVSNGTITSVSTPAGSGLTSSIVSGVLNLGLITTCAASQVLEWNGSQWVCSNVAGTGTVTNVIIAGTAGDISVSGTCNITTTGTCTADLVNTAVTPGSYTSANVTVDQKGRITSISNGGSSTAFQTNGTPLSSAATLNFINSAATNGITLTFSNPSSGNVQLGITGTLNNAGLTNSSTTVNGQTCTLGSTCTVPFQTNTVSNTSQAGINLLTSTANSVGLIVTPTNSATNQVKFEITGASYTGNAATSTVLSTSGSNTQVWGMTGSSQGWINQAAAGAVLLNPVASQTITQPGSTQLNLTGGPLVVTAGGSVNGVTFPDSGTSAQTIASANTAGYFSGAGPASDVCYGGSNIYQPIFTANVSGVSYSTQLEEMCNKDQKGGYPSLDPTFGLVPITEIVQDATNCNASTVPAGDQSKCISGISSPGWDQIAAPGSGVIKVNSGPGTWEIGNGLKLTTDGAGGIIDASSLNKTSWPSGAFGGAFNTVNAIPVTVASTVVGATMGASVPPNCTGVGCALGFNTTTHQFTSQNIALNSAHPMIYLSCTGTNNQCPNTSSVTGTGANAILYTFTLAANQLSVDGQCVHTTAQWKHTTGSAASTYAWNVGGTGSVGGAVTGGTTTATVSNAGGALFIDTLRICRASGSLTSTIVAEQWQLGTASGGPSSANASIDWTLPQQINFLFNVANTDTDTFWGGEVYYP